MTAFGGNPAGSGSDGAQDRGRLRLRRGPHRAGTVSGIGRGAGGRRHGDLGADPHSGLVERRGGARGNGGHAPAARPLARGRRSGPGGGSSGRGRRTACSPPSARSRPSPGPAMSSPAGCASRSTCGTRTTGCARTRSRRCASERPISPLGAGWISIGRSCAITRPFPAMTSLASRLAGAVAAPGHRVERLPSGAGHDAVTMSAVVPVGMLFVRCAGGVSHHPAESVTG